MPLSWRILAALKQKKTTIKEEDNEEEGRGKEIENDDGQLYYVSKT